MARRTGGADRNKDGADAGDPSLHRGVDIASPLVTLRGAAVRFGSTTALQPVELVLHRGERLALVGANGSGKTSLLRLSVRANVLVALWLQGVPRARRAARCAEALGRVGLLALARRPARELSGGQQQRLALARAWSLRPDILLLDEPTASLDPSAKREVEALIEDIATDGDTLAMSTHNLGQAKRLASRVIYLECGRLVVDLPVERFFSGPLPAEAALFVKGELPWDS